MKKVKVIVLRTAGTNCDVETAFAFEKVGASCELVHINRLISQDAKLDKYHILAIPGGFTYGDDIASGKILANEIKYKLKKDIIDFIKNGKLIIGICNGLQVLVKAGLLPNITGNFDKIEVTLTINDSGKFEDRWVYLRNMEYGLPAGRQARRNTECIWTKGIEEIIYLPVAHAEGKFIPQNNEIVKKMLDNGQIVFTYCDAKGKKAGYPCNPNGSVENIAGICDISGRVFGLMPHPERHIHRTQHPRWTRMRRIRLRQGFSGQGKPADGLKIFQNGVKAASRL